MKKNFILLATFSSLISSAFSQNMETREMPSFSKIEIESIAKVHLRQGSPQSVKINSEGLLRNVETEVRNNTLIIDGSTDADIQITIPTVEKLSISGHGEVTSEGSITSEELKLDISGDGKMNLAIRVKELKANISGLGKITLSGTAENTSLDIPGSGKIEALELQTTNCKANIAGLGKCTIDVTDDLITDISGSGSVVYKKEPKHLHENISGVGKTSEYCAAEGKTDTTRFMLGKSQVLIIGSKDSTRHQRKSATKPIWAGFEMGLNSYMNSSGNFSLPAGYEFLELREEKSISVGLNFAQKNIELGHSNVWFFTGLGITWNNYRFASNVTLNATTPISALVDTTSNIDYIKSKLVASYLDVPLMFEAFTSKNPKKAFHIGAGAMVGLRLMSHTKQKYELDDNTFKTKVYNDFGLNPFRLGVRAAVGYGHLNLYADYYFSTLFKNGKGPSLFPVNIGITLIGI
jgi:hypothetical protein